MKVERIGYDGSQGAKTLFEYGNTNEAVLGFYDTNANGKYEQLHFGWWGGSSQVTHTEDMTKWSEEKLALVGKQLHTIQFSYNAASTLILDKDTLAKASGGTLNIKGDSNDTIHLKDFTSADKVSSTATTDTYRVDIGGQNYNVIIENDVQLILG